MQKVKVYIERDENGIELDKSFDNIKKLFEKRYIGEGIIISASENEIVTSSFTFEKCTNNSSDKTSRQAEMTKEGASWFGSMRGSRVGNDTAAWQQLIERISNDFHNKYSFLEYEPIDFGKTNKIFNRDKTNIMNVLSFFLPELKDVDIVSNNDLENTVEDIFGVTLRLTISDGTGESLPILGKIFFRGQNNNLFPIQKDDAIAIKNSITTFKGEDNATDNKNNQPRSGSKGEIISALLNKISEVLDSKDGFQDYLILQDQRDINVIAGIIDRGPNERVSIFCNSAKVLSVFYVKWMQRCYFVQSKGADLLKIIFGFNDMVTFSCCLCDQGENLISANQIKFISDDAEQILFIDSNLEKLTTDKQVEELLLSNNPFKSHLQNIECASVGIGKTCKKFVCEKNTFVINQDDYAKNILPNRRSTKLCRDCPHLEKVFFHNDNPYPTLQMGLCNLEKVLVPAKIVKKCEVCGRTYSKFEGKGNICSFCKSIIDNANDNKEYKQLYKKYATMLPLGVRIITPNNRKKCNEDDDIILFNINGKIMKYSKNFTQGKSLIKDLKIVQKVK